MNHFLITVKDYNQLLSVESRLSLLGECENITELCDGKPHGLNIWLTNGVYSLIKKELFFITLLCLVFLTLGLIGTLSNLIALLMIVCLLFSFWLTGLIGFDLIGHYSRCIDTVKSNHEPLAVHLTSKVSLDRVKGALKESDFNHVYEV